MFTMLQTLAGIRTHELGSGRARELLQTAHTGTPVLHMSNLQEELLYFVLGKYAVRRHGVSLGW